MKSEMKMCNLRFEIWDLRFEIWDLRFESKIKMYSIFLQIIRHNFPINIAWKQCILNLFFHLIPFHFLHFTFYLFTSYFSHLTSHFLRENPSILLVISNAAQRSEKSIFWYGNRNLRQKLINRNFHITRQYAIGHFICILNLIGF